eukprot:3563659-Pleurochrysis_carterae.AAC.2
MTPPFCRANSLADRPSKIGPSCYLNSVSSQILTSPKHRCVANIEHGAWNAAANVVRGGACAPPSMAALARQPPEPQNSSWKSSAEQTPTWKVTNKVTPALPGGVAGLHSGFSYPFAYQIISALTDAMCHKALGSVGEVFGANTLSVGRNVAKTYSAYALKHTASDGT